MLSLIRIQTVWKSDGIPVIIFQQKKNGFDKKKSANDKKLAELPSRHMGESFQD